MYGHSGALTDLLSKFEKDEIQFDTLESILSFKEKWRTDIENHKEKQKNQLLIEIKQQKISLENLIEDYKYKIKERRYLLLKEKELNKIRIKTFAERPKNPIKAIYYYLKHKILVRRQNILVNSFEKELYHPFKKLDEFIQGSKANLSYKERNLEKVVENRSEWYSSKIKKIKSRIDSQYPLIAGAIGEKKAIEELEKLPDSYFVINNFKMRFKRPIFNWREKDQIFSIQVDHLVIAPSGIFLIETKNWSQKSIESLDLFSPVKQVKRASYALFKIINNVDNIQLSKHHWGEKKVTTRNIILMTNAIPKEEFQYVKILSLNRLQGYLTYFKEILSNEETRTIFNYLKNY
jgi:hypothetical protein